MPATTIYCNVLRLSIATMVATFVARTNVTRIVLMPVLQHCPIREIATISAWLSKDIFVFEKTFNGQLFCMTQLG